MEMCKEVNPEIYYNGLAQRMFQMMDLNKDNRIDFREFIISFSVGSRGTFYEKAYWIYQLCKNDDIIATEGDGLNTGSQLSLEEFIELARTHDKVVNILNSDMTNNYFREVAVM